MAQCRWCGKSGLFFRLDSLGLCDVCHEAIPGAINQLTGKIKEAFERIEKSAIPAVKADDYKAIMKYLEALKKYQKHGLLITLTIDGREFGLDELRKRCAKKLEEITPHRPMSVKSGMLTIHKGDDSPLVEIWQTRDDDGVCEICRKNSGRVRPQEPAHNDNCPIGCEHYSNPSSFLIATDIPACPDCRCNWRTVPQWWAELLHTNPEKAREIDNQGEITDPSATAVRDQKTGDIIGATWIEFPSWQNKSTDKKRQDTPSAELKPRWRWRKGIGWVKKSE